MVTTGKNGGLFGYVKDGKILNLGLTSGTIKIGGIGIGAFANSIENGVIDNCYSNITPSVGTGAAGIVYNVKNSTISDCYNTGNMNSGGYCAGIAVNAENSKISNCYNTGDLCNGGPRAGIVYSAKNTTISNCYNTGTIYSYQAGGIVSVPTDSVIINCYNKGNISDSSYAGGIVGYQAVNTTIKNCYNNGNVSTSNSSSSDNYAGGIVSYDLINSEIINCNNTGEVTSSSSSGATYSGGIVGRNSNSSKIIECYNKGKVTSKNFVGGIVGNCIVENSIISNCYNMGDISVTSSMPIGGLAYVISTNSTVTNCYNTGKVTGTTAPAGGIAYTIENCKISNCYNLGDVECENVAGGIAQYISNSTITNCYNRGNVTAAYPAGGLAQSVSNSEITNFYNTGIIAGNNGVGGIVPSSTNTTMKNCYYLNTSAEQGVYNKDDVQGQVEAKTEEEMKDKKFVKLLNSNKINIEEATATWLYNQDNYPSLDKMEFIKDKEITITNEKLARIVVHHYVVGTGAEFNIAPIVLAPDELKTGKVENEYTTSPNMKIEGYSLVKGEDGEYIIPENASGEFKEEEQHVYYYYSKKKLELTVHHYLEGTENKVPLGENEQGEELFAEDEYSEHNEGDHYKTTPSAEVLKTYELVGVLGDEEKDITQDEVVTYYYKIKKNEIITRVEIPEDELNSGRTEKGGSISGEGLTPYETVDYGKTSKEDIIVKPDENYRIKQIRLVSTNEEGAKQESIIYIEGKASEKEEQENAEITYKKNSDGSLTLTKFENMTEDKEVIVVFEKDAGKLIVHHYIEGTQEKIYDDQITIDMIGTEVETSPVRVENYVLVQEPADRIGTITKQVQEKIYYYQRQYKVTTDIIKYEEPNEAGEMQEVIGGTISGKGESSYEDILKGRNNKKEIVITPNEGFQITKITINGEEFDYSELLEENGNVVLPEQFFKNVDENKHIEVEFRRKTKVHVKYLEAVTKNVLAEEELIEGYVGKKFETERKNVPNYKIAKVGSSEGITNEAQEAVEPNGQMTKEEITIIYWYEKVPSGILVKHIEKVVTKKTNEETGKEEIKVTGVVLDEEVIKGYAGESKNTERKRLEGKYEGYVSAENLNSTEGINVPKDENQKQVIMKQDEVVEVIYWYEKAFKITTDVIEHEETKVNEETGKSETVKVKGGTISGEDETPYETVIRSNDSTKQIKIVPEEGYRIKQVKINGEEVFIKDKIAEDKTLTLTKENGYFKNVQEDKLIEVEFEKIPARVIVHYYLQGTGEEFENEPVILADEDIIIGTVNGKYITTPNMNIKGYTLIKDEKGEYIMPENKTGTLTEKDTHVYYYYTKDPVELIVHHYLEGTKDKVPLGKDEQGQNTFAEDEHYYYEEGEHYKTKPSEEVLKAYKLVKVVGDEEKDIMQNEEVIYYYQIKKYQITTRVEIPQEEIEAGRTEKGGNISGEEEKPYETVEHGKTSKEDIIVTPKQGYKVKEIRLVSTKKQDNNVGDNNQGNNQGDSNQGSSNKEIKTESIIYVDLTSPEKEETENAEITYKQNLDGSLILTKFENMQEDKEVIVVFKPVIGKVIVHHYIEGTKEKISEDEITEDLVGTEVQTKPVEKENYVVVEEPKDKNTVITEDTQEKIYYYQRQYKVTTDIIKYEEPNAEGEMEEVIGGTISGKGETSYEDILKGRNSQKEIKITPKDGFQITKITINGKEFDYSKLLKEDGSILLPKEFFKNVEENKHVEVEFRRKTKVHVKYLEVETKKELEAEELIEGYVGKDFETKRKNIPNYRTAKLEVSNIGITNENQEAVEPNGKMTKDEITIIYWYEKIPAGIIVKHIEKVTTKTINPETGKEEIKITGVLLDEEEVKGNVGESINTQRRKLEGKYECYIPAENTESKEGINVGKEENSKKVTFKENEVTEIIYWYEREFKITTDV
ncbi:MAG: MucBP domain-containing protein, partial [Clostridia bacterium]|nr:MucBP domain-containing protein [Clostridia bacterium]